MLEASAEKPPTNIFSGLSALLNHCLGGNFFTPTEKNRTSIHQNDAFKKNLPGVLLHWKARPAVTIALNTTYGTQFTAFCLMAWFKTTGNYSTPSMRTTPEIQTCTCRRFCEPIVWSYGCQASFLWIRFLTFSTPVPILEVWTSQGCPLLTNIKFVWLGWQKNSLTSLAQCFLEKFPIWSGFTSAEQKCLHWKSQLRTSAPYA